MKKTSIITTTTSSLDGYTVIEYMGPITAHLVAGTDVFSDFFASFTDFFGGRSGTYQKHIKRLYDDAIDICKNNASQLRANCILGLKVDLDEISGKGKAMFMITVSGTAAFVRRNEESKSENIRELEIVSVDELYIEMRKRELISKCESGSVIVDLELWKFASENQISEIFPYQLKFIPKGSLGYNVDEFRTNFTNYVMSLPRDVQITLLYHSLYKETDKNIVSYLTEFITTNSLFDFDKIMSLLRAEDFEIRKRAVSVSIANSEYYEKESLSQLRFVIVSLREKFPLQTKMVSIKGGILSSKEKEVIECSCGHTREISREYCNKCGKDSYGFQVGEKKPAEAIKILEERQEVLKSIFKRRISPIDNLDMPF